MGHKYVNRPNKRTQFCTKVKKYVLKRGEKEQIDNIFRPYPFVATNRIKIYREDVEHAQDKLFRGETRPAIATRFERGHNINLVTHASRTHIRVHDGQIIREVRIADD